MPFCRAAVPVAWLFGVLLAGSAAAAPPPAVQLKTFTYKRVGDLPLQLDVYRRTDVPRPLAAVWIHGGALINGHRGGISGRVKNMLLDAGYAVISVDYRLAPETKLPDIVADVVDALRWVRTRGPDLLSTAPERLAVLGGSAGGYLTLTAGHRLEPPPTVLVAFWGYGDLVGPWCSQPSPHPRHHRLTMARQEALALMQGPPVADSRRRSGDGGAFYQYCRQHGFWPEAVSGWDPHKQPEKYYPFMPVRNVTRRYPPTLLIHGTEDTDVPCEQSRMMARQLQQVGVPHRLITVAGAEHGLAGGDPQQISAAFRATLQFLDRYMKR